MSDVWTRVCLDCALAGAMSAGTYGAVIALLCVVRPTEELPRMLRSSGLVSAAIFLLVPLEFYFIVGAVALAALDALARFGLAWLTPVGRFVCVVLLWSAVIIVPRASWFRRRDGFEYCTVWLVPMLPVALLGLLREWQRWHGV